MRLVSNVSVQGAVLIANIDRFDSDDVLYWYDVVDQIHAEEIFQEKGCPAHLINDSYSFFETDWPTKIWCADLWLADELENFREIQPYSLQTDHTINFVINKKQINRYLAIKFCELFDLEKAYTWSGVDNRFDMTDIINEWQNAPFDDMVKNFLLAPINTEPHWVGQKANHDQSSIKYYGGNLQSWHWGIDKIVSRSAVSIITESQRFERAIHFSEKTAYAILGQTFPIWVGGYRQADEWSKMGFDVFGDVIDHSYQHYDTLIERCWYAFADNREILTNRHLAHQARQQHKSRLQKNFDLLRGNQVALAELAKISQWPAPIRKLTRYIINHVFPNLSINHCDPA